MKNKNMNNIINHLKKFGFVYQSSKIYGGLANT
jgi:glycyl-tRNA synthetase